MNLNLFPADVRFNIVEHAKHICQRRHIVVSDQVSDTQIVEAAASVLPQSRTCKLGLVQEIETLRAALRTLGWYGRPAIKCQDAPVEA